MSFSASPLPEETYAAAKRGELPKVVDWLRKGGDVDALHSWEDEGRSHSMALLHAAASHGHLAVAKALLQQGATVDLPDSLGQPPLMAANGRPAVLHLLLERSANLDLQDVNDDTALMLAAQEGHEACATALLRAKACTELRRKEQEAAASQAEATARPTAERSFGECAVCMDEMLLKHGRLALQCGHLFHRHCVPQVAGAG